MLSTVGGFIGIPGKLFHHPEWNLIEGFLAPIMLEIEHGEPHAAHHAVSLGLEWGLVALSVAVAAVGIWLAATFYLRDEVFARARALAERFPFAHRLLFNKYWIDEVYDAVIVRPIHRFSIFCWKILDQLAIDSVIVNGSAFAVELTGDLLRFTTTGNVRNYALAVAVAVAALALCLW